MNPGDGIFQHEPNDLASRFFTVPYRLAAGAPARWFMPTNSAPGTGEDYPGIDHGYPPSGTGDQYIWQQSSASGWPDFFTLIIEGCTHNGSSVTEGARHFLEFHSGGTSPTPLTVARPFFTVDGRDETPLDLRLHLLDPDNWEKHTTSLPSVIISGTRLYDACFKTDPLIGSTVAPDATPALGATSIDIADFAALWPSVGINPGFGRAIDANRVGDSVENILLTPINPVVRFGADPVRYKLTNGADAGGGVWSFDVDPPFIQRTVDEIDGTGGAVEYLNRHEIPQGAKFDVRLDFGPVTREKWTDGAFVSTDRSELICYGGALFYSPFEPTA